MAEQSICWSCRNATEKDCSWARSFEPVEGWEATETTKKGAGQTYIVHRCPRFVRDSWHYGQYRTKEEYLQYLATKAKNQKQKEERERKKLEEAKKTLEKNGIKIMEDDNE